MTDASTIFALSSAPGRAELGVIRISGPNGAAMPLKKMVSPVAEATRSGIPDHPPSLDRARALDRTVGALVSWRPTAKPAKHAEFQVHGSRAVIAATLAALGEIEGCRLAEPGEFARRGFENGKIDLAEVEGLADLVEAETEAQRRQALAQSSGKL